MVFEVRDLWPEAAIQMGVIGRHGFIGVTRRLSSASSTAGHARSSRSRPAWLPASWARASPRACTHGAKLGDLDLFTPGRKDAALDEEFNLSDKFVVGYAGAIGPSNDVEGNVPQAARILLERGRTDIVFLIAGVGKSLPALQEAVRDLPNVRLAGCTAKAEVPRFTRTADTLMVLFADKPILATNSPNKFFDGLASGKPMIVNSDGWTRDAGRGTPSGPLLPGG